MFYYIKYLRKIKSMKSTFKYSIEISNKKSADCISKGNLSLKLWNIRLTFIYLRFKTFFTNHYNLKGKVTYNTHLCGTSQVLLCGVFDKWSNSDLFLKKTPLLSFFILNLLYK